MKARLLYCILGLALLSSQVLSGASAQSSPISAAEPSAPQDTSQPVRIEGYVSALSPTEWTVGDFIVEVNASTRINEKRARASIGAWVVLWALTTDSGRLVADLIYVDRAAGQTKPTLQFAAVLNKKLDKWWVINGEAVQVGGDTVISGDPQVNDLVWVSGEQVDNLLLANAIDKVASNATEVPVEFEGEITKISLKAWRIQDVWVMVGPWTKVIGQQAIGKKAEVKALQSDNGSLSAQLIRVVEEPSQVVLGAMVAAITSQADGSQAWDMLVFPDAPWSDPLVTTVEVDDNALVDESRAVAQPGQWAEVQAVPLDGNEYQAGVIRLEQPVSVTIEGDLQQIAAVASSSDTNWRQIAGRAVWIPDQAVTMHAAGRNDKAVVEGLLLGNGVIWATRVRFP